MRRKRKDKLDRALNRICEKTPKFFARYCGGCEQEVRGEPMWRVSSWDYGGERKTWKCKRCAPTIVDLIKSMPYEFKDVDILPLVDDDARRAREESMRVD